MPHARGPAARGPFPRSTPRPAPSSGRPTPWARPSSRAPAHAPRPTRPSPRLCPSAALRARPAPCAAAHPALHHALLHMPRHTALLPLTHRATYLAQPSRARFVAAAVQCAPTFFPSRGAWLTRPRHAHGCDTDVPSANRPPMPAI
jgi:hypothetical protein